MLSDRVSLLKPSPTLALTAKVAELRRNGEQIVSFAAGEPDFGTPASVCEAGIEAIRAGYTRYTAGAGIPQLREAIAAKLLTDNGVKVEPSEVVVSAGAKQALFNAITALCNPGDEVILIAPYWMTYRDQVLLAGGKPVAVQTSRAEGYIPSADALKAAITSRTKAIVVNSPSNPTGAVLPRATLKEIAALALRNEIFVISDEIYERLVYDGEKHVSIASLGSEIAGRTITINGMSKAYAMTGWRIGYSAAPRPVAKAMSAIQDQVTSNASSISQYAALVALALPKEALTAMTEEFQCRRDLILQELAKIPGVTCPKPGGAFYAFPDVSAYLDGGDDVALSQKLLEGQKVATVPGSVFEGAGHLRLTYALDRAQISEGVRRISEGLQSKT
jgi:aspartate aminotransferase